MILSTLYSVVISSVWSLLILILLPSFVMFPAAYLVNFFYVLYIEVNFQVSATTTKVHKDNFLKFWHLSCLTKVVFHPSLSPFSSELFVYSVAFYGFSDFCIWLHCLHLPPSKRRLRLFICLCSISLQQSYCVTLIVKAFFSQDKIPEKPDKPFLRLSWSKPHRNN